MEKMTINFSGPITSGIYGFSYSFLICIVLMITILLLLRYKKIEAAAIVVLVMTILVIATNNPSSYISLLLNPSLLVMLAAGYFMLGIIWCVAKWIISLKLTSIEFVKKEKKFIQENNIEGNSIPSKFKKQWREYMKEYYDANGKFGINTDFLERESLLIAILFWPWDIANCVVTYASTKLFDSFLEKLTDVLNAISDKMIGHLR